MVPVAKRGRKKLTIDNSLLFDAFGEVHAAKFSKLKLFYDQDNGNKLKIFTEKIKYPYKLGHQVKEFEIVTNDITKGIEEGNNSRDLFDEEFKNFNMEFCPKFDASNKDMRDEARTLPPVTIDPQG